MMAEINNTQYFSFNTDPELRVKKVFDLVYNAMAEEGLQSGESDCRLYYVRGSDLYYQL